MEPAEVQLKCMCVMSCILIVFALVCLGNGGTSIVH